MARKRARAPRQEPQTFISQPHKGAIYILERVRRDSDRLAASVMPEKPAPGQFAADVPVALRCVPLSVRKAARAVLGIAGD